MVCLGCVRKDKMVERWEQDQKKRWGLSLANKVCKGYV